MIRYGGGKNNGKGSAYRYRRAVKRNMLDSIILLKR